MKPFRGSAALALATLFLASCGTVSPVWAQNTTGKVIATCGTVSPPFNAGNPGPFTVDVNGNLCVNLGATSGGGASTSSEIAPNNTTGVSVKGTAGTIYGVQLGGIGSAPAYLKIYDTASAPTCGSGTPIKRLIIPAASTAANGAGSNVSFGGSGIKTANGIGYCVTTGILDNDTTAPAASTFLINIDYN